MRILVQRYGALGDTIFMTSIIEPLRRQFGQDVKIDLLISEKAAPLFQSDPRIQTIFTLKSSGKALLYNPAKQRILLHALKRPYDLLIGMDTAPKSLRLARLIRAKQKILQPQSDRDKHIIEVYRDFYERFIDKKHLSHAAPSLLSTTKQETLDRLRLTRPYLVFSTTNSLTSRPQRKNYRAWPAEHWRQLIQLSQSMAYDIILLGSPNPLELEFVEQLGPFPENVRNLAGKTSLTETLNIISGAQVMLTTDTGPLHISAAMGTPTIALFGPSDFRHTGPFVAHNRQLTTVLNVDRFCSPCSKTERFNHCLKNLCMIELTPEKTYAALQALLAKIVRSKLYVSESVAELN